MQQLPLHILAIWHYLLSDQHTEPKLTCDGNQGPDNMYYSAGPVVEDH